MVDEITSLKTPLFICESLTTANTSEPYLFTSVLGESCRVETNSADQIVVVSISCTNILPTSKGRKRIYVHLWEVLT